MHPSRFAGSAVSFALAAALQASTAPPISQAPGFSDLASRWSAAMDTFDCPGLAVGIVKDGKIAAIEGFGFRDAARTKPVDPDTMFYIASITKTFVAADIARLADAGKLSLNDPVVRHLPRFRLPDPDASEDTTIKDLVGHRPGIDCGPIVILDAYSGEITDDRFFALLAGAKVRNQTAYSNVHYTLLGRIIEARTGLDWRDDLEQSIFKPTGMTRTTGYASRLFADPNHADPLERTPTGWAVCSNLKTDRTMHAAGGLATTAADACRWIMLHVNKGEIDGRRVLSEKAVEQALKMHTQHPKPEGSLRIMRGFGYGWNVGTYYDRPLAAHGGGYTGTSAYIALLPEQKAGLVILMNSGGIARGLQDVIAIDVLNRLAQLTDGRDLMAGYTKRSEELKQQVAEKAGAPAASPTLSQPSAAYAGIYRSNELGSMIVSVAEGDRLAVRIGECPLTIEPDQTDSFRVTGPFGGGGFVCQFRIGPGGAPESIKATIEDLPTPVMFKREGSAK